MRNREREREEKDIPRDGETDGWMEREGKERENKMVGRRGNKWTEKYQDDVDVRV